MSSQGIKPRSSFRSESTSTKYYEEFLEAFMKLCIEEDVCTVPQVVVLDKAGLAVPQVVVLDKAGLAVPQVVVLDKDGLAVPQEDARKFTVAVDDSEVQKHAAATSQKKGQLIFACGEQEILTAVYVRGLRVEMALLRAVGSCLSAHPAITELTLQNCSLTPEDVYLIALVLRESNVGQLRLDGNRLGDMCYSCLLQMSNNLQRLSLCSCQLGDLGVAYIAEALEHLGTPPHPLLRLNLSGNRVTCKGAEILASSLRTNRVLISLVLTGNRIEDAGTIALAEVFQKFQLKHEECIERRGRYFSQQLQQKPCFNVQEDLHPFLVEVERENCGLYCKGNFTLLHLNLSHNAIGLPGLLAFHEAVLYQESRLQPTDKGLLTVCFQGNPIPEDTPELLEMLKIFDKRLDMHKKSAKASSLDSSRSSSKTSALGSSNSSKTSGLGSSNSSKLSDTASIKH